MNNKNSPAVNLSNPLVSICTTFFNAERYIFRILESGINQTYQNIEIVIVDDASTDDGEKVIREYAARDPRVKYFRNKERTNIAECFLKMSHLANGNFAMILGADDWLKKDYVENGIRTFLKNPDIAGVIPDSISLFEDKNGIFNVGTGRARIFLDLAVSVFNALGKKPKIKFIEMPEEMQSKYQYFTEADTSSLRRIGYKQKFYDLEEGIRD